MSVLASDLVATVRQKANVEKSRFVSDTEILGFINTQVADLWNTLVNAREGYLAKSSAFSLAGRTSVNIAEACGGASVDDVGPLNLNPGGTVDHTTTDPQTFADGMAFTWPAGTSQGTLFGFRFFPDGGTCGADTTVTLYVNGEPTALTGVVKAGDSFEGFQSLETLQIASADVLTIVAQCSATDGDNWPWEAFIHCAAGENNSFLKELALSYTRHGRPQEIPPLRTLAERGRVSEPHYWLAGETLSFYPATRLPADPVTIDYIPRAPVLTLQQTIAIADGETNILDAYAQVLNMRLPSELERYRDFIEAGAVAKVKAKRQMTDEAAQWLGEQNTIRQRITQTLSNRTSGPRFIPMPPERGIFRRGWR